MYLFHLIYLFSIEQNVVAVQTLRYLSHHSFVIKVHFIRYFFLHSILIIDLGEVPINTGNATINTATANEQNATDITMNPGTTPQLLCSEIADRGGNVQASIIDVSQAAECNAAPLFNLLASKAPEAVHHNGESSTDSDN